MARKTTSTTATYEAGTIYDYTLMRSVRIEGAPLSRMDSHHADGAFLNKIVEQEGANAIATASPR